MTKILLAFLFCMFACANCHAFETGVWVSDVSPSGFEGVLEIRRDGCCDYQVRRIEFGQRKAGYLDAGCSLEGGEGQERDRGRRLDIFTQGELAFTIIRRQDYLQVYPNMTVNELICRKTGVPEWVRTFPNRDAIQREITELKWRKADSLPLQ